MKYYSSLALCALDAILSIRLNYDRHVVPAIKHMCSLIGIDMLAFNPYVMPNAEQQITVSDFKRTLIEKNLWDVDGLRTVIGNYKTAGSSQIYKAEAFIKFVNTLTKYKIETFQDLNSCADQDALERELRSIKGQKVAVDYFFMLAGELNDVKVDMHLTRFAQEATGVNHLSLSQIKNLFIEAAAFLTAKGISMTPRRLDHIVWNWQRNQ